MLGGVQRPVAATYYVNHTLKAAHLFVTGAMRDDINDVFNVAQKLVEKTTHIEISCKPSPQ